ncbi:uncharacterized protein LOC121236535 [Juglans microcarpa x Juglans regia]|uniref:uncharacterized protein LOC121236535 n=1 Tax=Juglans microcarpa x Juglans regia TaxID=2249226 RepID=UPI001B7EF8B0|nr:uncharacterized protein LOC121236535 [Juglans microcarpa x Juglans regia]
MWECPAATDVWGGKNSLLIKWKRQFFDFHFLWNEMRLKLSKEIVELVSIMFYQIWFKENNKDRSTCAEGTQGITPIPRWEPPAWPYLKANFDAAFDKEKVSMGGGVVIKDSDGSVQEVLTTYKDHISSTFQAESIALLGAMELCSELGFNQVCFEGDAKTIVNAANSKSVDN